jgi:two-component system, OmpR family, response regulator BaeR
MTASILIVEDEQKIAELLCDYMRIENYHPTHLDCGIGVVEFVRATPPDIIVLDLMLPGKDGHTICREIRTFSAVPIIMLTARVQEIDKLIGLDLGADDYVCKPFSPREVVARVRALLRRAAGRMAVSTAPIILDATRFFAIIGGKEMEFTPVEFRLLQTLLMQPGRVFSRNQLMDLLYTDHRVVSGRTVDSHVKNVRRKIVEAGGDESWLRSIYGVGYKIDW